MSPLKAKLIVIVQYQFSGTYISFNKNFKYRVTIEWHHSGSKSTVMLLEPLASVFQLFLQASSLSVHRTAASVGGSPAEAGGGSAPPGGQGHWQQMPWEALPGVSPPRV